MAITFNPAEIKSETLERMRASSLKDTSKRESSPFTDLGKELGIDLFRLSQKGFVDDQFIAYIPKMPEMYDKNGKRTKWVAPVTAHTLRKVGNGNSKDNYIGRIVNTRGREGFEEFGVSGKPEFLDGSDGYISKSWDYKNAHDLLVAAKQYGVSSLDDINEEERKELYREGFAFMPIGQAEAEYYFPIVIIDTEEEDGKHTMKPKQYPVLDENGEPVVNSKGKEVKEPRGTMMWFKASEKQLEKFAKALKPLNLEPEDSLEGYLMLFDYTLKPDEEKKGKGRSEFDTPEMKSAQGLSISVVPNYGGNAMLYTLLDKTGKFKEWDKEANEHYNELYLMLTVRKCQYESDEDLKAILDRHYGDIDAKIEQVKEQTAKILNLEAKSDHKQASKSALESTLGLSLDDSEDDEEDLDFGTED